MATGEGYGNHQEEVIKEVDLSKLPKFALAITPIILVLVVNYLLGKYVFATMDGAFLKDFGGIKISTVQGIWSLISALVVAIVVSLILFWKNLENVTNTVNKGAIGSLLAIANTSSEVGYGNVIKTLAGLLYFKLGYLLYQDHHLFH